MARPTRVPFGPWPMRWFTAVLMTKVFTARDRSDSVIDACLFKIFPRPGASLCGRKTAL